MLIDQLTVKKVSSFYLKPTDGNKLLTTKNIILSTWFAHGMNIFLKADPLLLQVKFPELFKVPFKL